MRLRRAWQGALLLLPLLILPVVFFGLSRGGVTGSPAAHTGGPRRELVVASANWAGIRDEMEAGFRGWLARRDGSDVRIEWLDLGGGAKILRWIEEKFERTPDGIGVDLMFGGGTDPYEELKSFGLLEPYAPDPDLMAGVARELGGFPIVDPDGTWFGTCITAFGIMTNRRVLDLVPELRGLDPRRWQDLADPRLRGWIGAADPRVSASAHTAYEIILQNHGFVDGMRLIRLIGGNVRAYTRHSAEIPKAVALGQVACAPSIDYYARAEIEKVGDAITFRLPDDGTLLNADCVGILKGAPHRDTARLFVDFLMSEDAALLWMLRKGEERGPIRTALNRAAVRPDVFAKVAGRTDVEENPFSLELRFEYDYARANLRWSLLNDLLAALVIDCADELAAATAAYEALDGEPRERAGALLFDVPFGEEEMMELARTRWHEERFREESRIAWARFARERYAAVVALGAAQ
jgi:ABC-type Fe3+ transport system substrate-binding protein